jgi:Tfp pilus assembly protein PilW
MMKVQSLSLRVAGVVMAVWVSACSQANPVKPSEVDGAIAGSTSEDASAISMSSTYPLITLMPNGTASPSSVSVAYGGRVRMFNNTSQERMIQSSNCTAFNYMVLSPGMSKNSLGFAPSGRVCQFWAMESGTKIFVGQVTVR